MYVPKGTYLSGCLFVNSLLTCVDLVQIANIALNTENKESLEK